MFDLRYYQQDAKAAVSGAWETNRSTAVIAATGTGKTELYLSVAVDALGRVLVVGHRDHLLAQPIARLAAHGFDDMAVEKAGQRSEVGLYRAKVVFASVQSLCRPERLARFKPRDFSVVIFDEAHRAVSPTYRREIDHFAADPRVKFLFLTATPKRKDGIALGNVCESVAYEYGPRRAADEGWIVPLKFYRREVPDLDFSGVGLKGGDLDPEQVERLLLEEKPLHYVCASLVDDREPTIVFCPRVGVARAFHGLMNRSYRPGRSAVLWEDSPDEERAVVAARLAAGDLDYLFNVDIATEGFDLPELYRVVWACPTTSLVKFTQGTGRVFRPHGSLRDLLRGDLSGAAERRRLIAESPKPFGSVVTYYPQNCKHQLCDPVDILGGDDLPPDAKRAAKQAAERMGGAAGVDPEKAIEASELLAELRRLLDDRRRGLRARAQTVDREYDGFGGHRQGRGGTDSGEVVAAAKAVGTDWPAGEPVTDKQHGWFRWKGIAVPDGTTKFRACVVRDLIELGVSAETAWSYGKRQALAVRAKMQAARQQEAAS